MHPHPHTSIPHPYLPLPSPATPGTSSASHRQYPPFHYPTSTSGRHASTGSSRDNNMEYSESEGSDGDDDKAEKNKLEIRREKNRVKQRNLRQRRANHIADLERNLSNARSDHAALQTSYVMLEQREANLQGWIHDLESALFRNGLAGDVEGLRRIWAERDSKEQRQSQSRPVSIQSHQQHQQHHAGGDPLSTLARAASSMPGPSSSDSRMMYNNSRPTLPRPSSFSSRPFENPYPTPEIAWGSQMHEYMTTPDMEKKRKRDSLYPDYGGPSNHPSSRPIVHPMAGRMSESNVHTLPPIQPYSHSSQSSPAVRPLSAPHSQAQPTLTTTTSGSGDSTPGQNVSPRSIRISDLVSPRPQLGESLPRSASTSGSGEMLSALRQDRGGHIGREGWSGPREEKEADLTPKSLAVVSEPGIRLPSMKFYDVGGVDRKPHSEYHDREREISPKTRLSPPPSRGSDGSSLKVESALEARA
ncbi:hypothetical protein IAR55_005543 [Kwoniella newhampshirensis]|uniref:BZIP domain-containing protein n=1 Tax=Kwoniella newhampshirensis TaxID=1651941 RepID=A0AAW0YI40_9TREE